MVLVVDPGVVVVVAALVVATAAETAEDVDDVSEEEVAAEDANGVVGAIVDAEAPPTGKAAEVVDIVPKSDLAADEFVVVPEVPAVVCAAAAAADVAAVVEDDVVAVGVGVDILAAVAADDDEGDILAVEEVSLGPEDVVEDGILAVVVAATLETVVLSAGLSSVKFCLELS